MKTGICFLLQVKKLLLMVSIGNSKLSELVILIISFLFAAQEIFRDVGKMLKYRRESDDLYSIYSYADEEGEDPALESEELNDKLKENEKAAEEKLNNVRMYRDY